MNEQKVLLVLGASSEIGLALLRAVHREYDVVVAHYNKTRDGLDALAQELGSKLIPVCADLSDKGAADAFVQWVETHYNPPAHIVHLPASKVSYKRFHQSDWDALQNDLNIQLRSIYTLTARVIRRMAKTKDARIVFVLTSNTVTPVKYMADYTTVKFALLGLMRSLAAEYPTICVNAVSPSMVDTRFISELPEAAVRQAAAASPKGRNAAVGDVVPAIAFLLSDGAGYISGQNIPVAGGGVL